LEFIDLNVFIREKTKKGASRSLRCEEKLPAILYGPGISPIKLYLNTPELETTFKGKGVERLVYNLSINNGGAAQNKKAMIKEVQKHPVNGSLIHVDFYEIDMERRIKLMIPVKTNGKSIGVESGGLLQVVRKRLEVLCYPANIPESIDIDINDLDIGHSIHVEDIKLAEGISIPHDVNFTVVTVLHTKGGAEEKEEEVEEETVVQEAKKTETKKSDSKKPDSKKSEGKDKK